MRITILANCDLHSNISVNLLLPYLEGHDVTLFLSEKVGRPRKGYQAPEGLLQLKFLEQDLFSNVLSPLAELQPSTEHRLLTFREIGDACGTPTRVIANANKGDGLRWFADSRPDVVVSIRYGCILREPAIAVPPLGILNLHSGLLPRYQGILTTLHSLIEDQDEVGCTLHFIDSPSIDSGPIVGTARVPVETDQSLLWHVLQLYPKGCRMIGEAIGALSKGEPLACMSQDGSEKKYYGLPEEEHFVALRNKGFSVWRRSDVVSLYPRYMSPPGSRASRSS